MSTQTDPGHTRQARAEIVASSPSSVGAPLAALFANLLTATAESRCEPLYHEVAWAGHLAVLAGLDPYVAMRDCLHSLSARYE